MPWWGSKVLSCMRGNRGNTLVGFPKVNPDVPNEVLNKKGRDEDHRGLTLKNSCWNCSICWWEIHSSCIPLPQKNPKNLWGTSHCNQACWKPAQNCASQPGEAENTGSNSIPSWGFWRTCYDLPTPQLTPVHTPKPMGCWTLTCWSEVLDVHECLRAPRCSTSSTSPWGISYQAPMQTEIPEWPKLTSGDRGVAAV